MIANNGECQGDNPAAVMTCHSIELAWLVLHWDCIAGSLPEVDFVGKSGCLAAVGDIHWAGLDYGEIAAVVVAVVADGVDAGADADAAVEQAVIVAVLQYSHGGIDYRVDYAVAVAAAVVVALAVGIGVAAVVAAAAAAAVFERGVEKEIG